MSHRERYTEHRPVRSSLGRHVGRAPADADVVDRYAADAYHEFRGVYFTEEQLERMPWQSRHLILSEAANIHGERGRRGR